MTERIELWDDPSPASTRAEMAIAGMFTSPCVRNVNRPTLTPFVVDGSDTAVIVCPGGGMVHLAIEHEGSQVAEWCNKQGASAYVLEYRMIPTTSDEDVQAQLAALITQPLLEGPLGQHLPIAGADIAAAIIWARARHKNVVIVGFSAGAYTVMEAALASDPSVRPDAVAAIYLPRYETRDVPADAPPLWVSAAMNDPLGVQGSFKVTEMWQQAKRPVELHLYEGGSHGYGMNTTGTSTDRWIEQLGAWLRMHKLL